MLCKWNSLNYFSIIFLSTKTGTILEYNKHERESSSTAKAVCLVFWCDDQIKTRAA